MSNMSNWIYLFIVTVRTVTVGHKMLANGHKTVAEGWDLFKEAVEEAGPRDLPQLLWQFKGKMMLMLMPTPPPPSLMEVGQGKGQLYHCNPQLKNSQVPQVVRNL